MLLKNINGKVEQIYLDEFKLEKDLQNFVEKNLDYLLDLEFVESEFTIENYRLDSLAFDKENKSFVIIEYKKGNSYSVIDQGYTYLSTVLNNKAEVVLEYNEKMQDTLKRNEIDWTQTKVIFISQSFNKYQKDSLNFKNLPIELYELKRYEGGLISFENIKGDSNAVDIKVIAGSNNVINDISKKVKKYTIEDHTKDSTEEIIELFEEYKERIELMYPDIKIEPKKLYIAFKNNKKNLVDFQLQKKGLKIWLNAKFGDIDDFKNLAKDVSNIGHWGNGDYEFTVSDDKDIEYILSLIQKVNNSK